MGEGFKRRHAKQFRHAQDVAHQQELEAPTIFSNRPETFSTVYGCRPTHAGQVLDVEAHYYAQHDEVGNTVAIFQGSQKVGDVEHGLDIMLAAFRSEAQAKGYMRVALQRQSALNGHFDIRCIEGDGKR